jgi:hypothetical protein
MKTRRHAKTLLSPPSSRRPHQPPRFRRPLPSISRHLRRSPLDLPKPKRQGDRPQRDLPLRLPRLPSARHASSSNPAASTAENQTPSEPASSACPTAPSRIVRPLNRARLVRLGPKSVSSTNEHAPTAVTPPNRSGSHQSTPRPTRTSLAFGRPYGKQTVRPARARRRLRRLNRRDRTRSQLRPLARAPTPAQARPRQVTPQFLARFGKTHAIQPVKAELRPSKTLFPLERRLRSH